MYKLLEFLHCQLKIEPKNEPKIQKVYLIASLGCSLQATPGCIHQWSDAAPLDNWHVDILIPTPSIKVNVFPLHEKPDNLFAPAPGCTDQGSLAFLVDCINLGGNSIVKLLA